jgi:uncharacterized membrane protein
MAFIDDLALIEVFLILVAAVLAYSGVRVWFAMRSNEPIALRKVLRSTAVPVGLVGSATLVLALWGEMTWPFPAGMAGYNIFFFDPLILLAFVLMGFAVSAYLSLKLQYVGVFAMIAGAAVVFYGWVGYTAHPAFTKDPFDTLLLYLGFGAAGIAALPATVVVDFYTGHTEHGKTPWLTGRANATSSGFRGLGTRAVQPVAPQVGGAAASPNETDLVFRMPKLLQAILLVFPVFVALAGIAAFWYFGVTLPGHLGAGAGAAP